MADDNKPAEKPDEQLPAGPKTPADVKKTPMRNPEVIRLEKQLSETEDKVDALAEAVNEVNKLLEGINLGGPPKPDSKKKIPVEFEANKFRKRDDDLTGTCDVDSFLFGNS
jgi:hypothetical protein